MPDNFKQVVNLQSKFENSESEPQPRTKPKPKPKAKPRPVVKAKPQPRPKVKRKAVVKRQVQQERPTKRESRVEEIDHLYNNEEQNIVLKEELSQIDRPSVRRGQNDFFKKLSIVFFLVIIAMLGFYSFTHRNQLVDRPEETVNIENKKGTWYSVQLTSKEIFYGFIRDTAADPVVLEKVYYNYNQISGEEKKDEEDTSSNIRLVKRGKESHGPDGTMDLVRSQVMYMEVLGEESKILKAILDYEE